MKQQRKKFLVALIVVSAMALFVVGAVGGCAPQVSSPASAGGDTPTASNDTASNDTAATEAVAFTWSADSDCATCHSAESASLEDAACAASSHAASDCMSCHADAAAVEAAHAEVSMGDRAPKRLKNTEIDEATCLGCHGSYEELAAKTENSTALTDKGGKQVNPHDLPENSDHDSATCSNCHAMHEAGSASNSALEFCRSCHHMDVFECGTCH